MSLKAIFCQDKAVSILQRAFAADKMPHAYIFAGAEGIGKFKTACEWAKLLLCKNPLIENGFADSCSSCQSCQLFQAGSHPDFDHIYKELREFTKDNKGKKTPVDLPKDVIREFLIDKVSIRPTQSDRKVFIISEAEKLNTASQNSLLKALEEPPQYCCIILICTRTERLLPTTKSRCRTIRFGPINEDRIIDKLKETGLNEKKAKYFTRLAQGSLGQACHWAQLELANANLYQTKKKLLHSLSTYEYADSLNLAHWLLAESKKIADIWADIQKTTSKTDINRRAAKTLVQIIISALHDAMKLNIAELQKITNFDQKEQIKKLAIRFNPQQTIKKISDAYKTIRWIDSAVNEKLIFEQLLLNLATPDIIKV
ncbi:MAG: DNA polymerase III subunit delta' [Planctomycetota bacterium]|nr:MAG: DNA polymerase III subunit delta' [Planctomycetota bacterium]